jgi:hypothetical protein
MITLISLLVNFKVLIWQRSLEPCSHHLIFLFVWNCLGELIWLLLNIVNFHAHWWLRTNSIFRWSWRWFLRSNSLFNKLVLSKIIQILYWIPHIIVLHSSILVRWSILHDFIRHSLSAWTCRSFLSCARTKRPWSCLACSQTSWTSFVLLVLWGQRSCWHPFATYLLCLLSELV